MRTHHFRLIPSCSNRTSSPPTTLHRLSMTTKWASRTYYAERSTFSPYPRPCALAEETHTGVAGLTSTAPRPLCCALAHPSKICASTSPAQHGWKQDVETKGRCPSFGLYGNSLAKVTCCDVSYTYTGAWVGTRRCAELARTRGMGYTYRTSGSE